MWEGEVKREEGKPGQERCQTIEMSGAEEGLPGQKLGQNEMRVVIAVLGLEVIAIGQIFTSRGILVQYFPN